MRSAWVFALLPAALLGVWAQEADYAYDDAGRLISADYGARGRIEYRYDASGSLLSEIITTGGPGPVLSIRLGPGGATLLQWAAGNSGFRVESTPALGSGTAWSVVAAVPSVVDGQYVLARPPAGRQMYFRLAR